MTSDLDNPAVNIGINKFTKCGFHAKWSEFIKAPAHSSASGYAFGPLARDVNMSYITALTSGKYLSKELPTVTSSESDPSVYHRRQCVGELTERLKAGAAIVRRANRRENQRARLDQIRLCETLWTKCC